MDKNTLEKNLQEIISYNNRVSKSMQEIYSGIENNNENRQILDEFLDYI
ncbi:MAG: hypothetical protein P1U46_00750 [Patescibacteria group bacterium]|nr:hypothetical protein [Patescibacteria group bacterium]